MRGTDLLAFALLTLAAGPAFAQTSSTGIKLDGDKPIQIESDRLEVREQESKAIFTGNVTVVQGPTLLKAGVMTVFYVKGAGDNANSTGSQQIDRLEVSNKVYIKSENQVATGDEGTFDVKSSTFTLKGKEVVLTDGGNVAQGCSLTVNTTT
ncbi:MAG: LPS ABC transporter substrate-binding protein LptA, partial [Hyphomicrobiales bacterium]|nr:LPS ABC transporter substrate-binding protein LptA [Hyphomicrobiales bacterium]